MLISVIYIVVFTINVIINMLHIMLTKSPLCQITAKTLMANYSMISSKLSMDFAIKGVGRLLARQSLLARVN